jgi:hypothetical protein
VPRQTTHRVSRYAGRDVSVVIFAQEEKIRSYSELIANVHP